MVIRPAIPPGSGSAQLAVSNARRWTIVWLLFAASMINYFDRQTLSFALPLLAKDFNLSPVQQGMLSSAFFWSYALAQIPIGLCADRFNLRWLYAGAFALCTGVRPRVAAHQVKHPALQPLAEQRCFGIF